ncbi:MAG TPA: hypothetical protein VEW48_09355 [Thermoanaerobaculia bacterium]|nr:hypothetical protein [Thermoanaerobaculia bacterium]
MRHPVVRLRFVHPAALGALILGLASGGCSFSPSGFINPDDLIPLMDDTPISMPTSAERTLVYESPGLLAVFHGTTCAESNRSGEEIPLRIQEELVLPKELDQGTVLLNGYRLRYLEDDHHVAGLGTAIGRILIDKGVLRWEAGGVLSDHNFDDGYEWCYTYTVLAWNSLQLQATVDHGDMKHAFRDVAWTHGTALLPVPGYLSNPAWTGLDEVAVLPRGFGTVWAEDDHHLLQFAYKHDSGEVYIQGERKYGNGTVAAPDTQAGNGFVSWETTGFLKDDEQQRSHVVVDYVSGLGGRDVGLITPPFTVLPHEDAGIGCASLAGGLHSEDFSVEAVPYEFAIPVLSGWDLAYVCGDEHVTEIGAWIPAWSWQPGTSSGGGTLRYTVASRLNDKDDFPDFYGRFQVKILGLRRITAPPRK